MIRIPDDCTVRLVDLPYRVGGTVALSPDGHYNIYINARSGDARRRASLLHEIDHIENGDFFNGLDIRTVEDRAGSRAVKLASIPALFRARDLLPPPTPRPTPKLTPKPAGPAKPAPDLSPYQARVLASALSELDRFVFAADPVRAGMEL